MQSIVIIILFFCLLTVVSAISADEEQGMCHCQHFFSHFCLRPQSKFVVCIGLMLDQQNRALEAATVTLRYSTALCPPMGKTREIFDLHFLAKPGFFQANYCDVTKVEVPNCMLTCT